MGGIFSSGEPRDVTFHPDDIILTEAAATRIKSASSIVSPPGIVRFLSPQYSVSDHSTQHEPELSLRNQYERELEQDYDRRLRMVEHRDEELFKEAAEEYTRTVERLESKYMRSIPGGCCTAAEQRVEDCYHANPNKTLLCSQLVEEYVRCVNTFRLATARKQAVSSM
ncbi:hypothetical protein EG68_04212 [Paragonimus skrjabini miyazakii]|uniref:MICOS complex subunit MIC19 n=1 Tax=Paragonimus skrjabini miyazakii TaxID=59628 RepID=A0A8S9YUZ2_9TREM|nr:hypothetical protein EG68_04212 [Paragonimus skrjabini miyazakii]